MKDIIRKEQLVPDHQFRFSNKDTTFDQEHVIDKCLGEKKICWVIF